MEGVKMVSWWVGEVLTSRGGPTSSVLQSSLTPLQSLRRHPPSKGLSPALSPVFIGDDVFLLNFTACLYADNVSLLLLVPLASAIVDH